MVISDNVKVVDGLRLASSVAPTESAELYVRKLVSRFSILRPFGSAYDVRFCNVASSYELRYDEEDGKYHP